MILFILGRQPELGIAELTAVFHQQPVPLTDHVAQLDISTSDALANAKRLGSVVKIAEVITPNISISKSSLTELATQLFASTEGKITLGISICDRKATKKSVNNLAQTLKDILEQGGHSVRLVPSTTAELSSATVLHNKLAHNNPKKVELIFTRHQDNHESDFTVGRTIYVQDINAYTFRDRRRPKRDARNGMLPPKLAQIMVNLAIGASARPIELISGTTSRQPDLSDKASPSSLASSDQASLILDPFCGTGVVLQEAALMGLAVRGTDLNEQMVDYTAQNIHWLEQTHHIRINSRFSQGDATCYSWQQLAGQLIDLVATETYLGRPYVTPPALSELKDNITNCNTVIRKFLDNILSQLPSGAGLCIAVPCWFVHNRAHHLPLINSLSSLPVVDLFAKQHLIYHRSEQIVGRELLVLRKK